MGAKTGANILSIAAHYATGEFEAAMILDTNGWYRVELWGLSASSLAADVDGLIEVLGSDSPLDPYNQMIILVEDYP
jgi:hypothetical protein